MIDVHPSACVDESVELGADVRVEAFAVVRGPCEIQDGAWIGPHASIGTPAQMRGGSHDPSLGRGVVIGRNTIVREFATIHQGCERSTVVGSDCYVMAYAHVPHDAVVGDGCTLSNAAQIGGHTWIGHGANVGLGATVHQRMTIGGFAMVGMQASVTRPVVPFMKVVGVPARPAGPNWVALEPFGIEPGAAGVEQALLAADPDDPLLRALRHHIIDFRAALQRSDAKPS